MAWVFVGTTADGRDHWRDAQANSDCWLEPNGSFTVQFRPMNDTEVQAAVTASTNVTVNTTAPNVYEYVDAGVVVGRVDATGVDLVKVAYTPNDDLTREQRRLNLEQTLGLR